MSARGVLGLVLAVLLLASSGTAHAHLMPADHGTLHVVDDAAYGVVSIRVAALHGFDDDGDGLLAMAELERHGDELRAEIGRRFVVSDGDAPGATVRVDLVLSPEHEAPTDRAGAVIALVHTRFAAPPSDLRLRCDLFAAGDAGARLDVTASRHVDGEKQAESAVLRPSSPEHRFFRPAVTRGGAGPLSAACVAGLLLVWAWNEKRRRRQGVGDWKRKRCVAL